MGKRTGPGVGLGKMAVENAQPALAFIEERRQRRRQTFGSRRQRREPRLTDDARDSTGSFSWNAGSVQIDFSYLPYFRAPTTHPITATVTSSIAAVTGSRSNVAASVKPKNGCKSWS